MSSSKLVKVTPLDEVPAESVARLKRERTLFVERVEAREAAEVEFVRAQSKLNDAQLEEKIAMLHFNRAVFQVIEMMGLSASKHTINVDATGVHVIEQTEQPSA